MTAYDARARATAARMLAPIAQGGYGQTVTLTHVSGGVSNPATSQVDGSVTTTQTTSGAVFEYTTFIRSGVRNEPGTLILAGDRQLLMSPYASDGTPLSPAPSVNDTVTLANGVVFTITAVATLKPAGLPVYFECNIRGAP